MSEIATYCEICRIYHAPRPRDRCEAHVRRDRSGAGRPLSAIGMSIVLAIGADPLLTAPTLAVGRVPRTDPSSPPVGSSQRSRGRGVSSS